MAVVSTRDEQMYFSTEEANVAKSKIKQAWGMAEHEFYEWVLARVNQTSVLALARDIDAVVGVPVTTMTLAKYISQWRDDALQDRHQVSIWGTRFNSKRPLTPWKQR